ncbi:MAG: DNA-3-methyladenine glycosylase 2 family protein [Verrucomicrobia bacterium]|nr:DNA-3-methyladenine glycosylase 2 family protein [Verrucomicrobiota bacterium]
MRLSHAAMYARILEEDASCNGRFFTGVLTTGIYCLPACKARKPRPENVRFFPSCEAARKAGLRPCRKCHPDDFARGADPILANIEALVAEIRSRPTAFPDVRAIVRRSGFGSTRLFELFRLHYHLTPADLLGRARLAIARQLLLATDAGLLDVAQSAGFESASVFHDSFRRQHGLTPGAYRDLRTARSFALHLPPGFPLPYLRRLLARDPFSLSERFHGDDFTCIVLHQGRPARLQLRLAPGILHVYADGVSADIAHARVAALVGLEQDADAFSRLARKLGLARLVAGREGLRVPQVSSVFEGVLWSILGQQINFRFACQLRRRLTELAGTQVAPELFAPPTPEAVASLDPAKLLPLQFSRQKADYLVTTARLIAEGRLDLEALKAMSATRVERTLLAIRGLGPWSVNYVMMRALGFGDCVPLGDTGVSSGLQTLLQLEERPDMDATRRLMAVFSPFRSLATAHLWQINQPIPS